VGPIEFLIRLRCLVQQVDEPHRKWANMALELMLKTASIPPSQLKRVFEEPCPQ